MRASSAPESGRIAKIIKTEGAESPEAERRIRRILLISRIELVLLLGVIFDMVVKPTLDYTWTIVIVTTLSVVASRGLDPPRLSAGVPGQRAGRIREAGRLARRSCLGGLAKPC